MRLFPLWRAIALQPVQPLTSMGSPFSFEREIPAESVLDLLRGDALSRHLHPGGELHLPARLYPVERLSDELDGRLVERGKKHPRKSFRWRIRHAHTWERPLAARRGSRKCAREAHRVRHFRDCPRQVENFWETQANSPLTREVQIWYHIWRMKVQDQIFRQWWRRGASFRGARSV